jgi:ubiquinone biosynthesis O-methyltransferase
LFHARTGLGKHNRGIDIRRPPAYCVGNCSAKGVADLSLTSASPPSAKVRRAAAVAFGIVCHVAFAVGVSTMIAAMYFGMSRSLGRVPAPWGSLGNLVLLAQFPLLHSLLLSSRGHRILERLAPAGMGSHLASTTYAIVASSQVFVLFAFWTPSGIVWWRAEGSALWLTSVAYAGAWLMLLKAIWDAGPALQTGHLGWWAVLNDKAPSYPPMPATGLFRIVRQPIYVSFALTLWTVPVWTPDQLVVAIVLTAYCVYGPLLKEKRFRQRFGQDFLVYSRRVPYWSPWPRPAAIRNDLSIYGAGADWWGGRQRWLRILQNLVPARFAFFDPIVGDWTGRRVLDVGCGGGFMAEELARQGAAVSAVDPSQAAIVSAKAHSEASGLTIRYLVGRGESLPFADREFDVVVCVDVLEHVRDLGLVIAEIRRVLRPGGLFLFDTINRTPLARFVMVTIGEHLARVVPCGAHDPTMFIRPDELCRALEKAGFDAGSFVGVGPRGLDRRLDLTFGFVPTLAIQYLGSATARA